MIEVVHVDVDCAPVTAVVLLDWDDAETILAPQMTIPMSRGWGFAEDASLTLLLAVALSVVLYVERAVRNVAAGE